MKPKKEKRERKSRRGSIAIVIVFGMAMAIVMLGMLRVSSAVYASGVNATKQYADINSMRAICQTSAYRYFTDLMSVSATRNRDLDMLGTTDMAVYVESLEVLQESLMGTHEVTAPDATGTLVTTTEPSLVWKVEDAVTSLGSMGELHADTQAQLLAMVTGKNHTFSIELEEDMVLDFADPTSFMGTNDARVAISPIKIKGTLKLKSETVVEHLVVEGAYLYAIKDIGTYDDGTTYNRVSMRITDDGSGSGVHIYRA